jgi:hypothetical protein
MYKFNIYFKYVYKSIILLVKFAMIWYFKFDIIKDNYYLNIIIK